MNPKSAYSGEEALELLKSSYFDLVFMDISMPGISGIEVTRIIRSRPDLFPKQPTIVALTANAMEGDKEIYLKAGMNDYIAKPFKQSDMDRVLEKWT